MRIVPDAALKRTTDCEVGELVRFRGFDHDIVAFIAHHSGKKFFILLNGERVGGTPCCTPVHNPMHVLWYGKNFEIVVDHNKATEFRPGDLYETTGCLLRTAEAWLMRVRASQGLGILYGAYCNLETGELVPSVDNVDAVTFGKWELQLPSKSSSDQPISLFAFNINPDDQEA